MPPSEMHTSEPTVAKGSLGDETPRAEMGPAREAELERMRYDRIASLYDLVEWPLENLVHRAIRRKLFAQVPAGVRFLEVGVGTGQNLELYPPGADATAIDLSPRMLARAGARAARRGIAVRLELGDIQDLHFADQSFDFVVGTFVFCSVPDPVAGLVELNRVCRAGGRILLLEHVRPKGTITGRIADWVDPFVARLWGAHINRRTIENVEAAGLELKHVRSYGMIRMIEAAPNHPGAAWCQGA